MMKSSELDPAANVDSHDINNNEIPMEEEVDSIEPLEETQNNTSEEDLVETRAPDEGPEPASQSPEEVSAAMMKSVICY